MAWSAKWYGALLAAQCLGAFMDHMMLSTVAQHQQQRTLGGTLGLLLQVARAFGVVSLGVLHDRMGPHVPLAISSLSYLLYGLAQAVLGLQGALLQVLRILAHPLFGFILLGLQDCAPEERTSFLARMYMMSLLGIFAEGHVSERSSSAATFGFVAVFALHAALSAYLTIGTRDGGSSQAGGVDGALVRKASFSPKSLLLPAPTNASPGMQEAVGKLLVRPEVYTIILILVSSNLVREARNTGMYIAAADKDMDAIGQQEYHQAVYAVVAVAAIAGAYLPARCIDGFGPKPVIQTLLQLLALIDVVLAVIFHLPLPGVLAAIRTLILQGAIVASTLAEMGLLVVCTVFFAGIVGPSERGTLLSFLLILDSGKGLRYQWSHTIFYVYRTGGVPPIYSLCAASSIALLLLYRSSVLVKFRLKEV